MPRLARLAALLLVACVPVLGGCCGWNPCLDACRPCEVPDVCDPCNPPPCEVCPTMKPGDPGWGCWRK